MARVAAAALADPLGFLDATSPAAAGYASPQTWISAPSLKNSGLAAVLSFFWPGLGQIYNGQIGKGICFLLLHFVFCVLILFLIGIPLVLSLWVIGIYDAYHEAEKINARASRRRF